jgi:hypothetical protein
MLSYFFIKMDRIVYQPPHSSIGPPEGPAGKHYRQTSTLQDGGCTMRAAAQIKPLSGSNLKNLVKPINNYITSLNVGAVMDGHKAVIRFANNYGVEIFKYPAADFVEMTVIKFTEKGMNDYEFAFNIPLPDLNLAYSDEDVFKLCEQVSQLQEA